MHEWSWVGLTRKPPAPPAALPILPPAYTEDHLLEHLVRHPESLAPPPAFHRSFIECVLASFRDEREALKVEALLEAHAHEHWCPTLALQWAACRGDEAAVRKWIPVADPSYDNARALCWAIQQGHLTTAVLLLQATDMAIHHPCLIDAALRSGRDDMLRLTLGSGDLPAYAVTESHLDRAVRERRYGAVKILLDHPGTTVDPSHLYFAASGLEDPTLCALLAPVSDAGSVWRDLLQIQDWESLELLSASAAPHWAPWMEAALAAAPDGGACMPRTAARLQAIRLGQAVSPTRVGTVEEHPRRNRL